jgi:serine/threonine-protein kinase
MEYFKGESLRERLRQGPMSLGPALDVIRQLGDALGAIHRIGVVHRDLKPDNVFLCPTVIEGKVRDVVKLIDFGIAKTADSDLTAVGVCFGTLSYMSPEQLRGEGDAIDQRTDVFALGAVVYEMLTGEKAFPGNRDVIVQRILYGVPTPLSQRVPSLPPQVTEAVDRALEKDRTKRLPDVASFVEALAARGAASPSPTPNVPTPFGPGEGLPTQATVAPMPATAATFLPTGVTIPLPVPHPRKWALAVVPAVALLASVAWSLIGHDKPDPLPHSQVEVELRLADAALREGRVWDAIDIATRTLEDEKTDRAFAIIARSYCKQGDVASAKAELEKIPAAQRQAILNDCDAGGATARR